MITYRSKNNVLLTLVVLAGLCLSCTFFKNKLSRNGGQPTIEFTRAVEGVKAFDYRSRTVSPGAVVARQLAIVDPSLASFADQIEAAEGGAIKQVMATAPTESKPAKIDTSSNSAPTVSLRNDLAMASLANVGNTELAMFQAGEISLPGTGDGMLVGGFAGFLKAMLSDVRGGRYSKKDSKTETKNGTTSVMNVEMGRNDDGSTVFGLGLDTESVKDGVKVTTQLQAKIEGPDCPNADGQVPITIKMHLSGASGSSRYTQDVTVLMRVVVGEDAETEKVMIDVTQGTSRGRNGQEVYVEGAQSIKSTKSGSGPEQASDTPVIQKTDSATQADVDEFNKSGRETGYGAAWGALSAAESVWQNGGCIKIEAKSPGSVAASSTHQIPVKVVHKDDGSEIAAKLDVVLSGESSVEPTVIPKTSGTLTYVAPSGAGMQATISLTANSRRGRATLDLKVSTGGNSYRIVGGLDDWQTDTNVCDIMKPFKLTSSILTLNFSGGMSGTYEYHGGPFNAQGSGTYTISLPDGPGKPGSMIGGGPGTITGDGKIYSGKGTEHYALTPIEPCQ